MQYRVQAQRTGRRPAYDLDGLRPIRTQGQSTRYAPISPPTKPIPMDKTRRGNYNSGEDFVLEYGDLRFTFNERDFSERCEQAARRLGFIGDDIADDQAEDLINLVVNGEVSDPASALGEHVNECWPELVGTSG